MDASLRAAVVGDQVSIVSSFERRYDGGVKRVTKVLVAAVLVAAAMASSIVGGFFLAPAVFFTARRKERHAAQLHAFEVAPSAANRLVI